MKKKDAFFEFLFDFRGFFLKRRGVSIAPPHVLFINYLTLRCSAAALQLAVPPPAGGVVPARAFPARNNRRGIRLASLGYTAPLRGASPRCGAVRPCAQPAAAWRQHKAAGSTNVGRSYRQASQPYLQRSPSRLSGLPDAWATGGSTRLPAVKK